VSAELHDRVRREIEELHHFFVGWFSGALPEDAFGDGFLRRFDPDFVLIPPAGVTLRLEDIAASVRQGHASNPDFRIAIRNVRIRREFGRHLLATYEEWQRNALASTPPENARVATVLFEKSEPLRWLHIHETSLPASIAAAGPYDF
jgi:hypothetical protein